MSDEERAGIEADLERLWDDYENVMVDWVNKDISFDDARVRQQKLWDEIYELALLLKE